MSHDVGPNFDEHIAGERRREFRAAQRHHDSLMPEPDPPEPTGAVPCVCGFEHPWFDCDLHEGLLRVQCKCGRQGPWRHSHSYAIAAWNLTIEALRKEE